MGVDTRTGDRHGPLARAVTQARIEEEKAMVDLIASGKMTAYEYLIEYRDMPVSLARAYAEQLQAQVDAGLESETEETYSSGMGFSG